MCCREDLEWSGAASTAPPCTVGYLAAAVPSLETARCQAAETHSQQLADVLTGRDRQAGGQKAPVKKEQMGAAGASNAACTVLVSSVPVVYKFGDCCCCACHDLSRPVSHACMQENLAQLKDCAWGGAAMLLATCNWLDVLKHACFWSVCKVSRLCA